MAIKKVTRKIISSQVKVPKVEAETPPEVEVEGKRTKKCFFCQSKKNPSYTDLESLRRFLTDRAKIVAKERSGACAKHQRAITRNIKYARHLSLLPFVPKV